jgi:hypothetical protein
MTVCEKEELGSGWLSERVALDGKLCCRGKTENEG